MRTQLTHNENGLTLIELLVGMALSTIVIGGAYSVFINTNKTLKNQNELVIMEQNIRGGLDYLLRELRMAGYNNGTPGTRAINAIPEVLLVGNDIVELTFVWDRAGDGMEADRTCAGNDGDIVTYRLDSAADAGYVDANHTRLMRSVGDPACPGGLSSQPLADNIAGLTFSFFDSKGNAITAINADASQANRDTIRAIEISMTANSQRLNPTTGNYTTHTMTAIVMPRNLGY